MRLSIKLTIPIFESPNVLDTYGYTIKGNRYDDTVSMLLYTKFFLRLMFLYYFITKVKIARMQEYWKQSEW